MREHRPFLLLSTVAILFAIGVIVYLSYVFFVEEPRAEALCADRGYSEGRASGSMYSCRDIEPDGRVGEWVWYNIQ